MDNVYSFFSISRDCIDTHFDTLALCHHGARAIQKKHMIPSERYQRP